jgi:hypothetical protein
MICVGITPQIAINFPFMVKVKGKRRMQLGLAKMRQALKYFVRRHTQLIISRHGADGNARAFDYGRPTRDPRFGGNVRILDDLRFHAHSIPYPNAEASNCCQSYCSPNMSNCGGGPSFCNFSRSALCRACGRTVPSGVSSDSSRLCKISFARSSTAFGTPASRATWMP